MKPYYEMNETERMDEDYRRYLEKFDSNREIEKLCIRINLAIELGSPIISTLDAKKLVDHIDKLAKATQERAIG